MLKELSVKEFTDVTSSNAPAPGGGSVSALCGALAAALGEMVANLTIGKKKYAEVEEDARRIREEADKLKERLIGLIDEDSNSFNLFMEALSLPKDTDKEKEYRKERMQLGLKEAAKVPLKTAETSLETFPLLKEILIKGNNNSETDALVGTMLAKTAVFGALYNVKINLSGIEDEEFKKEYNDKCLQLYLKAKEYEEEILNLGSIKLAE